MSLTAILAFVTAATFLGEEQTWDRARIEARIERGASQLDEVYLEGSGRAVVRALDGKHEVRAAFSISREEARAIFRLAAAAEVGWHTIRPVRAGDALTIWAADGSGLALSRAAAERATGALLGLVARAAALPPEYDGQILPSYEPFGAARVTWAAFSGRQDPTFILAADALDGVRARLADLPEAPDDARLPEGLGDRGFTLETAAPGLPARVAVGGGVLEMVWPDGRVERRRDESGLERWLREEAETRARGC